MRFFLCFFIFQLIQTFSFAQKDTIHAENGWYITPHGELRLLIIYVEFEFDVNPDKDPGNSNGWEPGKLPEYAGRYFDPFYTKPLQGKMSSYYDYMSMGNYRVLGDYLDYVVTIKESEVKNLNSVFSSDLRQAIVNKIEESPAGFKTHHGLKMEDFDMWTDNATAGALKINEPDSSFDHIMVFIRNHPRFGGGFTNPSQFTKLFGYGSDTYSIQRASREAEIIATHEFNHMLLGGNNFHATGGQHNSGGANYFLSFQGGFGMMGDANSMIRTCNAWDRDRLGWKHPDKQLLISAINEFGLEVNTNLSGDYSDKSLEFWVRDFVLYNDAIRIQLPNIPDTEFQQWLWIENHQGKSRNNCEYDDFLWSEVECRESAPAGVYLYLQVDKNEKYGKKAFTGNHYGEYIKLLPASGFYDVEYSDTTIQNDCVTYQPMFALIRKPENKNALSGSSELERIKGDYGEKLTNQKDGRITIKEIRVNYTEILNGKVDKGLPSLGKPRHLFKVDEVNDIHLGTNPSTASTLTEVSYYRPREEPRNNRSVYLNGIRIELLETRPNAENAKLEDIKIRVSFNRNQLEEDITWSADTVVIPPLKIGQTESLLLKKKVSLNLTRGKTPTRMLNPDTVNGEFYFNDPTHLVVSSGGILSLEKKAKLVLEDGSKLIIKPDSQLKLGKKSEIIVNKGSDLVQEIGAIVEQHRKSKIIYH